MQTLLNFNNSKKLRKAKQNICFSLDTNFNRIPPPPPKLALWIHNIIFIYSLHYFHPIKMLILFRKKMDCTIKLNSLYTAKMSFQCSPFEEKVKYYGDGYMWMGDEFNPHIQHISGWEALPWIRIVVLMNKWVDFYVEHKKSIFISGFRYK